MHDTVSFIYSQIIKCISKDYRIKGFCYRKNKWIAILKSPKSVERTNYIE